jgi:osmotically-inducible protein OsmY
MAALERETAVNVHRYPIEVNHDEHVRLSGVVENIIAKRRAVRIARTVSPGHQVLDHLRVEVGRQRQDDELRQAVLHTLLAESAFAEIRLVEGDTAPDGATQWIGLRAADGVVSLTGDVGSLSHRRLAEVLCWWTPGCADVDNRLRVKPPERDSDDEIADVIRMVLEMESAVDATQIGITVRDRLVTLRGEVRTEAARQIAEYDCWYVAGVHDVRNELTVE